MIKRSGTNEICQQMEPYESSWMEYGVYASSSQISSVRVRLCEVEETLNAICSSTLRFVTFPCTRRSSISSMSWILVCGSRLFELDKERHHPFATVIQTYTGFLDGRKVHRTVSSLFAQCEIPRGKNFRSLRNGSRVLRLDTKTTVGLQTFLALGLCFLECAKLSQGNPSLSLALSSSQPLKGTSGSVIVPGERVIGAMGCGKWVWVSCECTREVGRQEKPWVEGGMVWRERIGSSKSSQSLSIAHKWAVEID
ncbi:hypothetical protein Tco_0820982 [Tanacetum coccineum]|uniref:Uncharacterized protein n=1 Tax=Tanacetum coccineum TaxID=301880 RepID=A0ABQ5ABX6_9ASTR